MGSEMCIRDRMAGSGMEDIGTTSALNFGNLQSGYSTLGGSNNSYTNLMSAAAARDPYYQALLASGLGGTSGNSSATAGGANTVDLLQKCKYHIFVYKALLETEIFI